MRLVPVLLFVAGGLVGLLGLAAASYEAGMLAQGRASLDPVLLAVLVVAAGGMLAALGGLIAAAAEVLALLRDVPVPVPVDQHPPAAPSAALPGAAQAAPALHAIPMPDRALQVSTMTGEGHQLEWLVSPAELHGGWDGRTFVPRILRGRNLADGAPVQLDVGSMTWIGPRGGRQTNDAAAYLCEQAGVAAPAR